LRPCVLVGIGSVKYTLSIVKAVAKKLPREIHLHVFGLCAPAYYQEFKKLGIGSLDRSTHIQEGFKGRFLEAVEGRLKRHHCSSEKIEIPKCYCNPCQILEQMSLEPRLSNNRPNNLARVIHNLGTLTRSHRQARARQIILIACVAKKLDKPSPAKDLYCSQWFKTAWTYAKETKCEIYLLSAQHGLIDPNEILEPYECDPRKKKQAERIAWQKMVIRQLKQLAPSGTQFKIIGGKRYFNGIKESLENDSYEVSTPLKGLGIGWQLNWLKSQTPRYKQLSLL
jgi:hypothetical protein